MEKSFASLKRQEIREKKNRIKRIFARESPKERRYSSVRKIQENESRRWTPRYIIHVSLENHSLSFLSFLHHSRDPLRAHSFGPRQFAVTFVIRRKLYTAHYLCDDYAEGTLRRSALTADESLVYITFYCFSLFFFCFFESAF